MTWNPVDVPAKLPDGTGVVLAVWEGDWRNPMQTRTIRMGYVWRGEVRPNISYRTEEGAAYKVTHWMRPELPE